MKGAVRRCRTAVPVAWARARATVVPTPGAVCFVYRIGSGPVCPDSPIRRNVPAVARRSDFRSSGFRLVDERLFVERPKVGVDRHLCTAVAPIDICRRIRARHDAITMQYTTQISARGKRINHFRFRVVRVRAIKIINALLSKIIDGISWIWRVPRVPVASSLRAVSARSWSIAKRNDQNLASQVKS